MGPEELEVLEACQEAELRQREMLQPLAEALGVPLEEVFYTWALRRCTQRGHLPESSWVYFFHGLECDLQNTADSRFVRLDFGPGGRVDTLTPWGVLQFIMTAAPPWEEFAELKTRYSRAERGQARFSGDTERFGIVWQRLENEGCFAPSEPGLMDLLRQSTTTGTDGIQRVRFPAGTSERVRLDCAVAHRQHLTEHARRLLEPAQAVRTARVNRA